MTSKAELALQSKRTREIARLVLSGAQTPEVARRYGISKQAVGQRVRRLCRRIRPDVYRSVAREIALDNGYVVVRGWTVRDIRRHAELFMEAL